MDDVMVCLDGRERGGVIVGHVCGTEERAALCMWQQGGGTDAWVLMHVCKRVCVAEVLSVNRND